MVRENMGLGRESDLRGDRGTYQRAVGVFKNREDVEAVIRDLKGAGFDMERVSLIARNVKDVEGADEVSEQHGNEAAEGAGAGATAGTVLGGIGGLLVGLGALAVPGLGVAVVGAEVSALASTLAGAGIGAAAGGLVGALVGMGIPEEDAKVYNNRIQAGDYLLMVSDVGDNNEVERARDIMRRHNVENFDIYPASDLSEMGEVQQSSQPAPRMATMEEPATPTRNVGTIERQDRTVSDGPEVIIVDDRQNPR